MRRHAPRLWKTGLALWLLVTGTSPAFSDDHPDGDKPHSHGLGIFSGPSFVPVQSGGGLDPETRHFHIVIFGFEVHVPATCWAVSERVSLTSQTGFFQFNAEIGQALDRQVNDTPASALPAGVIDLTFRVSAQDLMPFAGPPPFPAAHYLCPLARGLCSGTQQI